MDDFFVDDWLSRHDGELTLGRMLRWQRMIDGLSLTDFKLITGIDRGLMCKYENGKKDPSDAHYDILIDYLGGEYDERVLEYEEQRALERGNESARL